MQKKNVHSDDLVDSKLKKKKKNPINLAPFQKYFP